MKPTNFAIACKIVLEMITKMEAKFENEIEDEDFPDLSKFKFPIYRVWRC